VLDEPTNNVDLSAARTFPLSLPQSALILSLLKHLSRLDCKVDSARPLLCEP